MNNAFLYIVKFLDKDISNYLKESEEAINFYYTVDDQRTGIKFSFALIYIIIVTLLLFLSITIAVRFSSRFFVSINNLISASNEIGKGNLNTKVPEILADKEIELLNKNFNSMIRQLKFQQEKLLISERHEAWEHVARKLAHEIKNPLTPIQLTIDNLKSKYEKYIDTSDKEKYKKSLTIILTQIKQIENLVNEFSDFARMPKPMFRNNNIKNLVNSNIELLKKTDETINFSLIHSKTDVFNLNCDYEQLSRAIFNLIKNSIESIQEKVEKIGDFDKKISIEIKRINHYITINIFDNGLGFASKIKKEIIKPYYTTKKKGSGLGLSIVNKIINDHNGNIEFNSDATETNIIINLPIK
jgi:two-component system nitrogen regulation sensor histidine kinase NtrY